MAKDALGHGSNSSGSHSMGTQNIGQKFRLNTFTHEIVSPTGEVAARMRLGKMNGVAVDQPGTAEISRSKSPSLHDAVAMADYRATGGGGGKNTSGRFPAENIGGELHYMTGNDFTGHTVRRVK